MQAVMGVFVGLLIMCIIGAGWNLTPAPQEVEAVKCIQGTVRIQFSDKKSDYGWLDTQYKCEAK